MRDVLRAAVVWLGVAMAAISWLAFPLRESAVAVVLDTVVVGTGAAVAALGLAATGLFLLRRQRDRRWSRSAAVVVIATAGVALGCWLWFRSSWQAEDVRFASDGIEIAGTLYTPRGEGPWPAAVYVHGSGPRTRREGSFLARYLARRGIAALAYDKRGTGESGGDLYASDYADYATDAAAGVRLLASVPEVDREGIGLVGVSEGEWVAPIAAARTNASFVVVIGASGVSPAEQVAGEMAMRLEARGHSDSARARALALNTRLLDYQRTGQGGEELAAALDEARDEPWFGDAEDFPPEVYPPEDYAWWRSVMDYDPQTLWRGVDAPVLLVKGAEDDRSPPGLMEERIRRALAAGGNRDLTVQVIPGADHALLEWPLGEGTPPPVFAAGYPELIVEWIHAELGHRR